MKFEAPEAKIEHAVARRLCFEEWGDWRYDPGNPAYEGYLRRARRVLRAIRECESYHACASGEKVSD